jgi:hypothetical protein
MARPASATVASQPTVPATSRSVYRDVRLNPEFDQQRQRDEAYRKLIEDNRAAAAQSRRNRDLSAQQTPHASRAQPYVEGSSTGSRSSAIPCGHIDERAASRGSKGRGESAPAENEPPMPRR